MDQGYGGDQEVSGIRLPENVVLELKRLGRAMESYSSGELQAAVIACSMDGRLIDDPDGANFLDQLELTDDEKRKRAGVHKNEGSNFMTPENADKEAAKGSHAEKQPTNKITSFCKRLLESRARRIQEEHDLAAS